MDSRRRAKREAIGAAGVPEVWRHSPKRPLGDDYEDFKLDEDDEVNGKKLRDVSPKRSSHKRKKGMLIRAAVGARCNHFFVCRKKEAQEIVQIFS